VRVPGDVADRDDEENGMDGGEAVVVDDVTETVQTVRIRERGTPHGGTSPRASARLSTDAEDR